MIEETIDREKLIRSAGEFDAYWNLSQILEYRRRVAIDILKKDDDFLEEVYEKCNQQIKNLLAL